MPPVISLEFTESECKVAVVDTGRGGRATVKSMSRFDLTRPEELDLRVAERSKALRDHLKAQRISVKQATLVIPKNFVMVRAANLPSTVDDEIAGMARFEAERHIPFNAERHIIGYHVQSKNGSQGSTVLLAAVDLPIAKEYLDICVNAGLRITGITVSSVALFNSFSVARQSDLVDRTVMLVNVGRNGTDVVIVANGNVSFARGSTTGVNKLLAELEEVNQPAQLSDLSKMDALEPQLYFREPSVVAPPPPPPTPGEPMGAGEAFTSDRAGGVGTDAALLPDESEAGFTIVDPPAPAIDPPAPAVATAPENKPAVVFSGWLNRMLQEIKRTFEFASREFATPMVDHIYISGEGAQVAHLAEYFQANFHVETSVFDPLVAGSPITGPKKVEAGAGETYAVAIGGPLSNLPKTANVNLLPGAYTEEQTAKRQQLSYIVTGVLVLVALALGYLHLSDTFARKQDLLDQLLDQNRADKARVDDLRTKKERLRIISENVQDDRGALAVLGIISEKAYIPENLAIREFDYKRGDFVKMSGDAKDLPAVNQFVSDMRHTGFFAEAGLDPNGIEPNRPLRGRGGATVTGWRATFTFPKPERRPARSSRPAAERDDDNGFE